LNQWILLSLGTIHWWNELHYNPSNVVLLSLNVLIYWKPSICTQGQAVPDNHIILFISKIRSVFPSYPFFFSILICYISSLLTQSLLVLSLVSGFYYNNIYYFLLLTFLWAESFLFSTLSCSTCICFSISPSKLFSYYSWPFMLLVLLLSFCPYNYYLLTQYLMSQCIVP
jgi:hypothetical protein